MEAFRAKEEDISNAANIGVDYNAGNATVLELLERYISLKQGVRNATKVGYNFACNLVKKETSGTACPNNYVNLYQFTKTEL